MMKKMVELSANYRFKILAIFTLFFVIGTASADEGGDARGTPARAVVELYTSQGCYSCPPADILLKELIDNRNDVVALEFHVDYWDDLVYGSAGSWRDPFSNADFTRRQRQYNSTPMGGRTGVYTPQMVVNGQHALVGSNRDALYMGINKQSRLPVDVHIDKRDGAYIVSLDGTPTDSADIWQIRFIPAASTQVVRGENNGKTMHNHHIVTEFKHIGRMQNDKLEVKIEPDSSNRTNCAVLVQNNTGHILGAAYCPS
ncbi:MAG: hypothetical protein DHS20C01_12780 [marine bacterium B5-7]|nr:MAG: hypothetical protein DHS20C01_12780 [marine bacterium B5-7]